MEQFRYGERHIILQPLLTIPELLHNQQLEAREFWQKVEHPELGNKVTYPGPFIKSLEVPLSPDHRAPSIGEHNREIYHDWMGFSMEDIIVLQREGVI